VNRYGPPPSLLDALRNLDARTLRVHPYDAEADFATAFAEYCGVDRSPLVVGRGITEFLGILARLFPPSDRVVITPDYTDTIRLVPRHLGPPRGARDTAADRLARVHTAMRHHRCVVLSNPNNPLGFHLPREELVAICRRFPRSTLVVDEAYADFTGNRTQSMFGCDLDNVVVLQAPNKPFGIAGVRTGALWTRDDGLRADVRRDLPNWPISQVDSVLATAALQARDWARTTLGRLRAAGRQLEELLQEQFGDAVITDDVPVHYRFVLHDDPQGIGEFLATRGVVVRVFCGDVRGRIPGVRIVAPTDDEMAWVAGALAGMPAHLRRNGWPR
jgi:histidinol-phosphate aminotransferase